MNSTLTEFSKKLLDYIETNSDKSKAGVLITIKKYTEEISLKKDIEINNQTHYNINYNNPRIEQHSKYEQYYDERGEQYNKWVSNKESEDLFDLVKIFPPVFKNIPEVYTYNYVKGKRKKEIVEKVQDEEVIDIKPDEDINLPLVNDIKEEIKFNEVYKEDDKPPPKKKVIKKKDVTKKT